MMNENKVLKSLKDIENTLKNIDAAKQQAEKTIVSCNNIGLAIKEYSEGMEQISQSLREIVEGLKNKQEFLSRDLNHILSDARTEFKNQANNLNAEIARVRALDAQITAISKDTSSLRIEFKDQADNLDVGIAMVRAVDAHVETISKEIFSLKNDVSTTMKIGIAMHLLTIASITSIIVLSFLK